MQINYESYVAVALYSITQAALAYSLMSIFHGKRAIDDSIEFASIKSYSFRKRFSDENFQIKCSLQIFPIP